MLGVTTPAAAAPEPRGQFVAGNLAFVLLHELAHLVVSEFDVPVFGPEEEAADYIAAAALLRQEETGRGAGLPARAYLYSTAEALGENWRMGRANGSEAPYWGSHALSIQRFYQVACLIYGSDPAADAGLPARIGLPPDRARDCPTEYARTERSLRWLVETYRRPAGSPGAGASLTVDYGNPRSRVQQDLLAELQATGTIDRIAGRFNELFALRSPARIALRNCGRPEAGWQPATRELVLCLELLDSYYRLYPRVTHLEAGAVAR